MSRNVKALPSKAYSRAIRRPPCAQPLLAEPQRYVIEEFARVGLTFERVGETLLEVMQNQESTERVAAAKLFIDATIGRAPTTARNLHVHAKADKFFDEKTFSQAPQPRIEED